MSGNAFLVRLHSKLLDIEIEETKEAELGKKSRETIESTSNQVFYALLKKIFEGAAEIINPKFLEFRDSTPDEVWKKCIKLIKEELCSDASKLVKPIAAIWKQYNLVNLPEEHKVQSDAHWNMIVILPKNYMTCFGISLQNKSEKIFLMHSEMGECAQKEIKLMLSKEYTDWSLACGESVDQGFLMTPEIIRYNYDESQTQKIINFGWLTLCSVCMCIMKGSFPSFNRSVSQCMPTLDLRVRALFQSLGFNAEEEGKESNQNNILNSQTLFQVKENANYVPGESNFIEFVRTNTPFVDKSLFIKEVLQKDCPNRLIIIRPRRWGKSLNLSMLIEFLNAEVDNDGNIIKYNSNYPLFARGELTDSKGKPMSIKKLKIATIENGIYLEEQGQYPVIDITFKYTSKNEFNGNNPSYQSMRDAISDTYERHTYISEIIRGRLKKVTSPDQRRDIKRELKKFDDYLSTNSNSRLEKAISFLGKLLYKYLERRVYVIIDEFDLPIKSLKIDSSAYINASDLITKMLTNAFKSSQQDRFVAKIILTGVFEIPLKTLGSGLNHVNVCNVLSPRFPSYFGFTEEELNDLIDEIVERIKVLFDSQALRQLFIEGKIVKYLSSTTEEAKKIYTKEEELLRLLIFSGYLTKTVLENTYVLPNLEVKTYVYKHFFSIWMKGYLDLSNDLEILPIAATLSNNIESLNEYIEELDEKLISKLTQCNLTKARFHNLLGGLAMYATIVIPSATHTVYSKIANEYEKIPDSVFKPVSGRGSACIIHKYKKADSETTAKKAMRNAFWQIYSQNHLRLVLRDIDPQSTSFIITRAIVFYRSKLNRWRICAKGFKHMLDQAIEIDQIFSVASCGALENSNILFGADKHLKREVEKTEFFKPLGIATLYQVLRRYSEEELMKIKKKDKTAPKYKKSYSELRCQTNPKKRFN